MHAVLLCQQPTDVVEVSNKRLIGIRHGIDAPYRRSGNDEKMEWGGGGNVADGHAEIVLVLKGSWYLSVDDSLEECGFHTAASLRLVFVMVLKNAIGVVQGVQAFVGGATRSSIGRGKLVGMNHGNTTPPCRMRLSKRASG
jgi:hypothetical protein